MKKLIYGIFALTLMAGAACNQSSSGNKTNATSAHQMNEMTGNELMACSHQTKIYWKGSKPTGEHNGLIKLKDGGKFIVDGDKLIGGEFVIDMNSILDMDLEDEKMNAKLVNHLKSEDFFYVDSFPEAKFVITKVADLKGNPEFTHQIDGNLTIKGITKGISFKANVKIHNGIVSATSEEFVLDRTQWNVNYGSKSVFKELQDKFINDEFSLLIDAHSM